MIPRCYPTLMDGRKSGYMQVFFLSSVAGLTKWIDYIPVKTVAFSATAEGTTNVGGHINVTQVASSATGKWVNYIPVFEDVAATVPWTTDANGYIPVNQMLNLDFLAGVLDSRITFTRASSGTHFDSTGRLVTDTNDVARFDYDPATLLPRGLLIEEARTQLLLHSRDMTQAAWSKTDVTVARTQVGIDGAANSACLMTEGSAGTAKTTQAATVSAGATIAVSIVAKYGNAPWFTIAIGDSGLANGMQAWFNVQTGANGSTSTFGLATGVTSSVVNLGGGWYRCNLSCTPSGVYTSATIASNSASANSSFSRVANATYIVDCAQLEVGAFATSIIISGAATATRAVDNASMTGANFSSWWNASAGSFVLESSPQSPTTNGLNQVGIQASDNTLNNRIVLFRGATGGGSSNNVVGGGVSLHNTSNGVMAQNVVAKQAQAYANADYAFTFNGSAAVTSNTAGTIAALNRLDIGARHDGGATYFNGHIRSIRYYNQRLGNQTLQSLTA